MAPALPAALLALLLAVPLATAQAEEMTELRIEVAPFPTPATPLQGTIQADVTVEAPCAMPGLSPSDARVDLWVMETPPWAKLVLAPSTFDVDPATCQNGRLVHAAVLTATVDNLAPAFTPTPFRLGVAWEGGLSNATSETTGKIESAYFSVLDVALDQAIQTVEPGGTAVFPLQVTNLGNDATRVFVEVESVAEGFRAAVPEPVVLESRQKGGTAVTAEIPLTVHAPSGAGYVNQAGSVTFRIRSENADDAALRGDDTTVAVLVTAKGLDAPGPHAALVPLLGVLAALALRRRTP